MQRSFRSLLIVIVVLAASLPAAMVAIPFGIHIHRQTQDAADRELRLAAERSAADIEHALAFVSDRFQTLGQNKDMILATTSPFFSNRAVWLAEEFMRMSPSVSAVFLADNQFRMVEGSPDVAEIAPLSGILDAARNDLRDPARFRGRPYWKVINDPQLLAALAESRHGPVPQGDSRLLLLTMPLFDTHYLPSRSEELQGVLFALVPVEQLLQASRSHLLPAQHLSLEERLADEREKSRMQLADAPLKLSPSAQRELWLSLRVTEPKAVRFASLWRTLSGLALAVLLVAACFSALGYWLARRMGRPLENLQRIADSYVRGDYRPARLSLGGFSEFRQVAGALSDLGEKIESQIADLREANEQLRRADKLKDDFLANTSHELRTPLHGIVGIASSLLDGAVGELPAKVFRNVRLIEQSGRRLEALVNDILDFSKIRHQALQLDCRPLDIFSLVDMVLALHARQAERAGLQLINAVSPQLPLVSADEFRLQQILHNLVANALQYTPEGSVTVEACMHQGRVRLAVRDTGMGIPVERQARIFEPFVRVEEASGRSGVGLGLSITRQLVELHGSSLELTSSPGQGSVFAFSLPLAGEEPLVQPASPRVLFEWVDQTLLDEPTATNGEETVVDKTAHVLVVDDEPVNRAILENYFAHEPYALHMASSGVEALELLDSLPEVDLILLDVMMPRLNGFEVCKRIRECSRFDHVPILLLTARHQARDIQLGYSMGANDYLVKPISRLELVTRCQYHLNYARIKAELAGLNVSLEAEVGRRTEELQQTLDIIRRNNELFRCLVEISIELQNSEDLTASLQLTLERLGALYPDRGLAVFLYRAGGAGEIRMTHMPNELVPLLKAIAREGRDPVFVPQLGERLMVLPLFGHGKRLIGQLMITLPELETQEREVAQIYGRQLVAAIENRHLTAELERLTIVDPLTGAYNRRYFERTFANMMYAYARHPERMFAVLSIDVNGLKTANDTFGHAAGDALILKVVDALRDCLRQNDTICRIGGDEFVVLLEDADLKACQALAQRLLDIQQGLCVDIDGADGRALCIPVRFSVGVASTEETRPEDLLRIADQRMYEAKQAYYAKNPAA